jgi:hypothetical protein
MDSRDQFETTGRNFGAHEPEVSTGEYPSKMLKRLLGRTTNEVTEEPAKRFSDGACVKRSNWGGDIMWTFAFGEKETSRMAESAFSSGRQAWHLLKHMNDLCKAREGAMLRSSALVIQLASELRAMALECLEARFALELRVVKGADGWPDLELMNNGRWRKPSLRVNTDSQLGTMMIKMGG